MAGKGGRRRPVGRPPVRPKRRADRERMQAERAATKRAGYVRVTLVVPPEEAEALRDMQPINRLKALRIAAEMDGDDDLVADLTAKLGVAERDLVRKRRARHEAKCAEEAERQHAERQRELAELRQRAASEAAIRPALRAARPSWMAG